jgi:hypothetical protein
MRKSNPQAAAAGSIHGAAEAAGELHRSRSKDEFVGICLLDADDALQRILGGSCPFDVSHKLEDLIAILLQECASHMENADRVLLLGQATGGTDDKCWTGPPTYSTGNGRSQGPGALAPDCMAAATDGWFGGRFDGSNRGAVKQRFVSSDEPSLGRVHASVPPNGGSRCYRFQYRFRLIDLQCAEGFEEKICARNNRM